MTTTTGISNTGSVVTLGSTTYIQSTASGLDTASLIQTALATQTAMADTIDTEITSNQQMISAYSDVQSLVNSLSSSIDALASSTNLTSGTTSLFSSMDATVTSSDASVSASNILTASTTTDATEGSYSLTVSQLATSMKVASSTLSGSTAVGDTGSFTIAASDGTAATIDVTSGMSLSDIASAISAQSATTGVDATLIQVSSGQYQMVLSTVDTGQTITATATSGDDVLTDIGVTNSDGSFADTLQSAQDALFTVDGTQVTSTTNTPTDVIPGVSLDLTGTTSTGSSLTLTISQNTSGITSAVQSFITAYNALNDYIGTQEAESDGVVSSTAYLFGDPTLASLNTQLDDIITGQVGSASSAIDYLAQLGITMDSSNDLELSDPTALSDAASDDPTALKSFFQSSFSTSSDNLSLINNTSDVSQSFTLDVTADSSGVSAVTVNGESGQFTVAGDALIGVAGTPYAGLTFAINATSDQSISVSISQGFADSIVNLASQFGDIASGSFETAIAGLTTEDTSLSNQASTIQSQASSYETSLIDQYATMETEISSATIMQEELNAILNSNSNS
jgi:flagellar hook-associated protein 2